VTAISNLHETPVRQGFQGRLVCDLLAPAANSRVMQFPIDLRSEKRACSVQANRLLPAVHKSFEPFPPAFRTWPVPGRECHSFVEEEEFRVESGRHHLPPAALEIQKADDPTLTLEQTNDLATVIVQRPSTISHESSTRRSSENRSVGVDTVLQRHPEGSSLYR
jgi:hypothetical protein